MPWYTFSLTPAWVPPRLRPVAQQTRQISWPGTYLIGTKVCFCWSAPVWEGQQRDQCLWTAERSLFLHRPGRCSVSSGALWPPSHSSFCGPSGGHFLSFMTSGHEHPCGGWHPPHHSVQPCRTLQAMLTDGGTLTSEKVEGLGTTCDRAATLNGCHFLLGEWP